MINFYGRPDNAQVVEINIEQSELPPDWEQLDEDRKLQYLMANYQDAIFAAFKENLTVDFDFEESTT